MNNEISWSAAREARIDRAIDRAVREMMQVDPPPGLRRRVLARLDRPAKRRGQLLPQFALAAVALAVLALSLTQVWYRGEPPTPPKAPVVATRSIEPVQAPPEPLNPSPKPAPITRERIAMPHITNVFGNRAAGASAATIDGITRQVVATPLEIVPLSARPLVIKPLIVPPLQKGGQ